MTDDLEVHLKEIIADVPDFPKPGILFKDITPVLEDPQTLRYVIDHFAEHYKDAGVQRIAGIESRGFIFGTALAYAMDVGITLVRKPGKLPRDTHKVEYDLEYGTDTLEIHQDSFEDGTRVLIVDDLLATGGTASATIELVESAGGVVAGCAFVIELSFLKGRKWLGDNDVYSIVTY